MDKDFVKMDRAVKSTDKLAHSIQVMDQLKKVTMMTRPTATMKHKTYAASQTVSFARESGTLPKQRTLQITNHKASDQQVIEKRLVSQLGDRYTHASLIELRPNSYLISQHVRLPVIGRPAMLIERSKETMSKKDFLMMKDNEFYAQEKSYTGQFFGLNNATAHKYKLDPVATMVL